MKKPDVCLLEEEFELHYKNKNTNEELMTVVRAYSKQQAKEKFLQTIVDDYELLNVKTHRMKYTLVFKDLNKK